MASCDLDDAINQSHSDQRELAGEAQAVHWSITSFVTSFVTSKVFVMHYELRNHYEALVMLSNDYYILRLLVMSFVSLHTPYKG